MSAMTASAPVSSIDEYAPWSTVRDFENERLVAQIEVARRSRFYASIDWVPGDSGSIPFTEKRDVVASQIGNLFASNLSCAPEDVVLIQGTSGTSGKILRLPFTPQDIESYAATGARAFRAAGVRPGVPVLMSLNYHMYAGGVADHRAVERAGGACIPISSGNTARLVKLLAEIPTPCILYATPSYALHLTETVERVDLPRGWNLERVVLSGEAGAADPDIRAHLESVFEAPVRDYFGLAEIGAQSSECEYLTGLHWTGHGIVMYDLIDPDTGAAIELAPGAIGEAVYTTLERQAAPLLRFRSHDLVKIVGMDCECGRSGPRFRVLGRTDDLLVIRGVNLYPSAVRDVLVRSRLVAPPVRFELVVQDPPPHLRPIRLCIETEQESKEFTQTVAALCKSELNVSFEVVAVAPRSLGRSEHKTSLVRKDYVE